MRPSELPPWSIVEENKKKSELSFLIGAKNEQSFFKYVKKRRCVTRSLARGSEVENKSKVKGSIPVKPSNFDVRTYAKLFGCVFVSFF